MAKKTKKTAAKMSSKVESGVVDGRVHILIGARPSKDFASATFEVGLDLSIPDGKTANEALEEGLEILMSRFEKDAGPVVARIVKFNEDVKRRR